MRAVNRVFAVIIAVMLSLFAVACAPKGEKNDLVIYMPDGAPALAFAELMAGDSVDDGVSYRVVQPTLIASKVTAKNEDKNADFCVLPITAASKLLGDATAYRMLATVTNGNLYLVSKTGETVSSLSVLLGKTVGVIQINEVPGLTLKSVLTAQGVAWQELKNGVSVSADKVNLKPVAGVDGTLSYYLIAEPAVSKQAVNGWAVVGDIQAFYGGGGYPQAVLVAKKSVIEEDGARVSALLDALATANTWLTTASADDIYAAVVGHFEDKGATPAFSAATLQRETILRCGISVRVDGLQARTEQYLNGLSAIGSGMRLPVKEFYYGA